MFVASSGVDVLLSYAALAKAGDVLLDAEVAEDAARACAEAVEGLTERRQAMFRRKEMLPLGEFPCGTQLAQILADVAQQFVDRLDEHIVCLRAIHDMVGAQVADSLTTDQETSDAFARVTSQIVG
ncbi:hypothetical protein [Skermania piniformis]|uniref:Uncharacterized protein n=1 Tax=Skermania pinensis TaxID=39122 RepID=A0ABX8S4N1_9ACTN|nr:hypothetical protein [Skermania piniformis]QXQ12798.1 hypothetical protein KV203_12755 [Skermania piniformis]